jgi:hypothetical protein
LVELAEKEGTGEEEEPNVDESMAKMWKMYSFWGADPTHASIIERRTCAKQETAKPCRSTEKNPRRSPRFRMHRFVKNISGQSEDGCRDNSDMESFFAHLRASRPFRADIYHLPLNLAPIPAKIILASYLMFT